MIWWFPVIAQVAKDCHSIQSVIIVMISYICSCETRKIFQVRRTGWWPCTHSICKCFLWRKFFIGSLKLYGSFPWNFRVGALVSPLGLPVVPGWLLAVDFWWLQTDLPNTRDAGDKWSPEKKNNEKPMAKLCTFEITEKYSKITTGNELLDGVPKSKQNFHDDKGQRCVKMGQDLHGCKTSDSQDAFALKVTSKGLWETLSLFRRWGLCTNCHAKNLQI